jgi:chromosomal replication initiator protein
MNEYKEMEVKDHVRLWNECLAVIKDNIPSSAFETWFRPIVPESWENMTMTITVPSNFYAEFLDEHYSDLLKQTFNRVMGKGTKLVYSIIQEAATQTTVERNSGHVIPVKESSNADSYNPFPERSNRKRIEPQLNPHYTFDTFVEGACNKLARSAGLAIAEAPGKNTFNPIFIYGGSGLGKTHLAQAIGWATLEKHPEKKVLYVDSNRFQAQYTDAHLRNCVNDFIAFYQMIDLLIVDDIQFFAGKTGTQNVFFQIFNQLQLNGKQIVLVADQSPKLLQGLDDRMLTRFRWGLNAELEQPSSETRKAILKSKVKTDGLTIPDNVIDYIAERVSDSVRELEGVVNSLLAQSTLTDAEINMDLVSRVVNSLVSTPERTVTVSSIQETVCNYYGLEPRMLQSNSRKREVVQARQIAMFLSRKYTKVSLSSIGEQIGNRDHATVLYACKAIQNLVEVDKEVQRSVEAIESSLR